MRIVRADFARRIELHGVGACPRPVDIGTADHDFEALVSLRVYAFSAGMVIHGDAEDDEVYVVLMDGAAEVAVAQETVEAGHWLLDPRGGARAVYLPPLSSYRLRARTDCAIAYARAVPRGSVPPPAGFAPAGGRLAADHATRMTMTLAPMAAGEKATLDGGERFVHLRGQGAATLAHGTLAHGTLAERALHDWDAALLDDGEQAALTVTQGTVEMLTIGATAR